MSSLKIGVSYVGFGVMSDGRLVATAIHLQFIHPSKSQVVVYAGRTPSILLRDSDVDITVHYCPSKMAPPKEILEVTKTQLTEWVKARILKAKYEIVRGENSPHGNNYHFAKIVWSGDPIPGFDWGDAILHDSYFK